MSLSETLKVTGYVLVTDKIFGRGRGFLFTYTCRLGAETLNIVLSFIIDVHFVQVLLLVFPKMWRFPYPFGSCNPVRIYRRKINDKDDDHESGTEKDNKLPSCDVVYNASTFCRIVYLFALKNCKNAIFTKSVQFVWLYAATKEELNGFSLNLF